jgi:hypothetical protein
MSYIPKELLLKSYKTLSKLTDDHKQGQTQYTSAVRYLVAFDSFFYKNNSNCDLDSSENREEFVGYVRDVVNVIDSYYTANFYTTIKSMEDCGVGSNFFSAGVVNNSKQNTSFLYDYPTRGKYPLFKVRDNELIREDSYYRNVRNYLHNEDLKCAFAVWLLRNRNIDNLDANNIKKVLLTFHTSELVNAIMPKEEKLNEFVEGYTLNLNKTTLAVDDLMNLFISNTHKEVDIINNKYRSYITAIKSKPFLLLAGISGTGKSRIVRELARACWDEGSEEFKAQKLKNFEMIQVKPNWHDSSELIGYVSRIDGVRYVVGPFLRFMVKAIKDPKTPYFLCLDEMNLAPVEQYFAEYLSVIESRKLQDDGSIITDPIIDFSNTEEYQSLIFQLFPDDEKMRKEYLTEEGGMRLSIPQNLIVVGTVNMDETTFSFSRKVLDRAMTIEMNEVDLFGGLDKRYEQIGKLSNVELVANAVEGVDVYKNNKNICDTAIRYLNKINTVLDGTPFKIAYRTRNEVLLYVVNNLPYNIGADGELQEQYVVARALDEITNMKILSRIEGDETKVSKSFLDDLGKSIKEGLEEISGGQFDTVESDDACKSISLAKLDEMKKRLSSGFVSFWS